MCEEKNNFHNGQSESNKASNSTALLRTADILKKIAIGDTVEIPRNEADEFFSTLNDDNYVSLLDKSICFETGIVRIRKGA